MGRPQLKTSSTEFPLVPQPWGGEVARTHPLVVIHHGAGGANGEGGGGSHALTQGQALLCVRACDAHL